jgi:hypothetical protein
VNTLISVVSDILNRLTLNPSPKERDFIKFDYLLLFLLKCLYFNFSSTQLLASKIGKSLSFGEGLRVRLIVGLSLSL